MKDVDFALSFGSVEQEKQILSNNKPPDSDSEDHDRKYDFHCDLMN